MIPRFAVVPADVVLDGDLTLHQLRVLMVLALHADRDRSSFPSQRRIAELVGSSRSRVNATLQELEAEGYVRSGRRHRSDGSETSKTYEVIFDLGLSQSETGVYHPDETGGVSPRRDTINRPLEQTTSIYRSDQFNQFWAEYPLKSKKLEAERVFKQLVKSGTATAEVIIDGARRYRAATSKKDRQYVQGPPAWLRAGRWMDEGLNEGTTKRASPEDIAAAKARIEATEARMSAERKARWNENPAA